jgi:CheY-like chemotaxis protein
MRTPKVLVLDDQPAMMRYWWNALESSGFNVVRCQTTEEAAREYSADNYDLIILDRMMPTGEVFHGSDTQVNITAGETVLSDQRKRGHLRDVPVIIFTSYDDQEVAQKLSAQDPRFRLVHKSTVPTELVKIARQMVEHYPVEAKQPEVLEDQHPNTAPYYVRNAQTGAPVRMSFVQCVPEGSAFLKPSSRGSWLWSSVLEYYLSDGQLYKHVSRLVPHQGPGSDAQTDDIAEGAFYNGGRDAQWYRNILFEAAPGNRYGDDDRRMTGVGKALVVRFLRECLYRHGIREEDILMGTHQLDDDQVKIQATRTATAFLQSLGFVCNPSTGIFTVSHDAARRLIADVTYPEGRKG